MEDVYSQTQVSLSVSLKACPYLNWIETSLQSKLINSHPICIQCALIMLIVFTLPEQGNLSFAD